jgi:hypothetical protein
MVNHYIHVTERAADYKIMINSHEAVHNWTKPHLSNWIAQESQPGTEFEAMGVSSRTYYNLTIYLSDGRPNGLHLVFFIDLSYYNTGGNQRVNTISKTAGLLCNNV